MTTASAETLQVEIEGAQVTALQAGAHTTEGRLEPGDVYIARRNQGWKLLTLREMKMTSWVEDGRTLTVPDYAIAEEIAYSYNACECHKVVSIDG